MSKCENIEIPVQVFRHLRCFTKPAYVSGMGFNPYPYGCGFHGYRYGLDHVDPCQTHVPPYLYIMALSIYNAIRVVHRYG